MLASLRLAKGHGGHFHVTNGSHMTCDDLFIVVEMSARRDERANDEKKKKLALWCQDVEDKALTMPTKKLQQIILPEIRKRLEEKRSAVILFQEKLQICSDILVERGIIAKEDSINNAIVLAIKKFPIDVVEQALEEMLEEERIRVNKNKIH